MDEKQAAFQEFVMDSVEPGREDDAKALLDEGFARRDAGTFDEDYINEVKPRYEDVLKPEHHNRFWEAIKREVDLLNRAG